MSPPSLEIQMIVKNEAAHLERCIQSVGGIADRILIGDTGSTDSTVEIAQRLGAIVLQVPWSNDFSAARNAVLHQAKCDWILIIDPDEMLDPDGPTQLQTAIQNSSIAGYDVTRWHYMSSTNSRSGEQGAVRNPGALPCSLAYPAYTTTVNTRLFRRRDDVYFERPVHETVVYRLRFLRLPVAPAPFVIHHFGHVEDNPADRKHKNELYYEIGLRHLQQNPDDALTCFELGLTHLEHYKNSESALSLFQQALRVNPSDWRASIYVGVCLNLMGRWPEAIAQLQSARKIDSRSIILHEILGDSYFHLGNYPQALAAYTAAKDIGCTSAVVLAKRGLCQIYCGNPHDGLRALQDALQAEPESPEILDLVTGGAVLAGNGQFAAAIACHRLDLPNLTADHYVLASTLLRATGDVERGRMVLSDGNAKFPLNRAISTESAHYRTTADQQSNPASMESKV